MISGLKTIALAAAMACAAPIASHTVAPAATAPERIPAEAIAEPPVIREPVMSPDGNRLAARLTADDKEWIGVYDLRQDLGTQRPIVVEWGDYDVTWMRWAGNNRLIFGIQLLRPVPGFDMELPVTRAGSLDLTTGATTPLIGGTGILGDDVIFVDPEGRYVLLSSQASLTDYPSVDRIDLATGRATLVQASRQGVWNWFADGQGVVRAGVDYGENRLRLYYRSRAGQDLRRIDSPSTMRDGSVIDSIRFTEAPDRGIIVTNEVSGRFGVYEYDFATRTRGAALFEHDSVDAGTLMSDPNGRLLGVSYEDDRPRMRWLDPELGRIQAIVDRALPDKTNRILDRSADGNKYLVWSAAADDPGTLFLYDRAARQLHGFATPYARLNNRAFAPMRHVTYRSRDGLTIPAYLTLPPGRSERGLALIVMPHGGPFARDSWSFDPWVQFLASRGYAVLQPNYRGSTGYGRDFAERGFGQFGTGMIDDIEDGVHWLAGQGIADPARVCIMGASYGGYAALWAPIRNPERYRCAISFAGISDLRAMVRYDWRAYSPTRYSRAWRSRVEGERGADLAAVSPLQQVARVRVPLLIAHGEKDRRVPVSQSRNFIRALQRGGARVESVIYPEAAHGFSRPRDSADFLRRVEAFLAQHNPA